MAGFSAAIMTPAGRSEHIHEFSTQRKTGIKDISKNIFPLVKYNMQRMFRLEISGQSIAHRIFIQLCLKGAKEFVPDD